MKKFHYPLEKVRQWRQIQLDTEQVRLQALLAERRKIEERREQLERDLAASAASLQEGGPLHAEELQALNSFSLFVQDQNIRLKQLARQVGQAIDSQRDTVLAARRGVEMLERHREKRLEQWKAEAGREQENLVAELVVARWKAAGR